MLKQMFSIKNEYNNNKKYKVIKILGLKIKHSVKNKRRKIEFSCISITTKMGCTNNCVYCPQSTLLNTYFKDNKNRVSTMSLDAFKIFLKNIPKKTALSFGGFSEHFENPECIDMIKYAVSQGRAVYVYTTLRGVTLEQLKEISHINFVNFCVHTPDIDKLQHQEITQDYLEKVEFVKNFHNVEFLVIGRADSNIRKILGEKLISHKVISRGNNLDLSKIPEQVPRAYEEQEHHRGAIICRKILEYYTKCQTGNATKILLPDGTLVLCCMDWGMKHQLGNLYENTYEQIINGDLVKDIVSQMRCEDSDVICRDCEWAIPFDENKWKNYLKTGNYTTSLPFYKRIKNIFFNK